ncbi:hypothetical protein DU490_08990 [Halomonas sp. DQ26W]|uniref:hypothetical protein n=1 Tax=Halomonas sp. DQ26W TaxID=2282311 RepID=UPI000DF78E54|nr:hypothetical protein [Halomonas sp. DQ26W]RDB43280.1 hypothetical protein DU490_08990 [Halomonas sp. DQ26W]
MILRFFIGSLYLMGQHRYAILKGISLPSFIYLALQAVIYGLSNAGPLYNDLGLLLHIPFSLAEMAIVTIISISAMRTVLLDERPEVFRFSKRELRFFLYYIGFLIVWLMPSMFIGVSSALVFHSIWLVFIPLMFFLVGVFFTLRLSLVFVGVAIDKKISLRDSYGMTHRAQWALFISLAIYSALFFMFYYLWGLAAGLIESESLNPISFFLVFPLLDIFVYVLISIVLAVLYSEAYQPAVNETSATQTSL